jgi:hypothetical protein
MKSFISLLFIGGLVLTLPNKNILAQSESSSTSDMAPNIIESLLTIPSTTTSNHNESESEKKEESKKHEEENDKSNKDSSAESGDQNVSTETTSTATSSGSEETKSDEPVVEEVKSKPSTPLVSPKKSTPKKEIKTTSVVTATTTASTTIPVLGSTGNGVLGQAELQSVYPANVYEKHVLSPRISVILKMTALLLGGIGIYSLLEYALQPQSRVRKLVVYPNAMYYQRK